MLQQALNSYLGGSWKAPASIREVASGLVANSVVGMQCVLRVKEHSGLHRPAWKVFVKPVGTDGIPLSSRGRHLFSVIA